MFSTIKAARMLGWASLGVGTIELFATRWLEGVLGVKRHSTLIRSFGLRELAAGFMILDQVGLNQKLVAGLWSRVLGDAMDLATLGASAENTRRPEGVQRVTAVVAGITAMDIAVALLAHKDLIKASRISSRAKERVQRRPAQPAATNQTATDQTIPRRNDQEGAANVAAS